MSNISKIRNFGIIAHIDAGKTTTTEKILYTTGTNHYSGEVDEGTTTTDWLTEERERGISIVASGVVFNYKSHDFHLIDTPGHIDFTAEVQRSLRVLDGVIIVFCGVGGVQTQTELVWHQASRYKIPAVGYINKLDRTGANYQDVLIEIEEKLLIPTAVINFPVYRDNKLYGVGSVLNGEVEIYNDHGQIIAREKPDEDILNEIKNHYNTIVDILSSHDDRIAAAYLEGAISKELIIESLRSLTLQRKVLPVVTGSSLKNIGIESLIDLIINYLPSPEDCDVLKVFKNNQEGTVNTDMYNDTIGYIFKIQFDQDKGMMVYLRVYSGEIVPGDRFYNARTGFRERVHDIFKLFGNSFERIDKAVRGDIVIITGFKQSTTGDTVTGTDSGITLEKVEFPEPVIHIKVEPESHADHEKFEKIIDHLIYEDPTIRINENKETGDMIISGMGELHLEVVLDRIYREHKIKLSRGKPRVAYREKPAVFDKILLNYKPEGVQDGLEVEFVINPLITGDQIRIYSIHKYDKELSQAVINGINKALLSGPSGAYKVIECEVVYTIKNFDERKHKIGLVEAACGYGIYSLLKQCGTIILEPFVKVFVSVPTDNTGTVMGDIQSRSGTITNIEQKSRIDLIHSVVPLSNMFGYLTDLRNITHGQGTYTMEFAYFAPVRKL